MKKIFVTPMIWCLLALLAGCNQQQSPEAGNQSRSQDNVAAGQHLPAGSVLLDIKPNDGKMLTTVGKVVEGKGLESTGTAGQLLFGPYAAMDSGRYKVTVYGNFEGTQPANPLNIDVAYGQGASVVKRTDVEPGNAQADTLASFEFILPNKVTDLEVRAKVTDGAHVIIKGYRIVVE